MKSLKQSVNESFNVDENKDIQAIWTGMSISKRTELLDKLFPETANVNMKFAKDKNLKELPNNIKSKLYSALSKPIVNESLITEGKWGKIMKGVKSGSQTGPWVIVVIDKSGSKSKVIHQQPVEIRDAIPANYENVKKEYPKAMISIEDNEGHSVYNEQF